MAKRPVKKSAPAPKAAPHPPQTTVGMTALQQIETTVLNAVRLNASFAELGQWFDAVRQELNAGVLNARELGKVNNLPEESVG